MIALKGEILFQRQGRSHRAAQHYIWCPGNLGLNDEAIQQACPEISEDFLIRQKFRQIQMMVEIDTDSSSARLPPPCEEVLPGLLIDGAREKGWIR